MKWMAACQQRSKRYSWLFLLVVFLSSSNNMFLGGSRRLVAAFSVSTNIGCGRRTFSRLAAAARRPRIYRTADDDDAQQGFRPFSSYYQQQKELQKQKQPPVEQDSGSTQQQQQQEHEETMAAAPFDIPSEMMPKETKPNVETKSTMPPPKPDIQPERIKEPPMAETIPTKKQAIVDPPQARSSPRVLPLEDNDDIPPFQRPSEMVAQSQEKQKRQQQHKVPETSNEIAAERPSQSLQPDEILPPLPVDGLSGIVQPTRPSQSLEPDEILPPIPDDGLSSAKAFQSLPPDAMFPAKAARSTISIGKSSVPAGRSRNLPDEDDGDEPYASLSAFSKAMEKDDIQIQAPPSIIQPPPSFPSVDTTEDIQIQPPAVPVQAETSMVEEDTSKNADFQIKKPATRQTAIPKYQEDDEDMEDWEVDDDDDDKPASSSKASPSISALLKQELMDTLQHILGDANKAASVATPAPARRQESPCSSTRRRFEDEDEDDETKPREYRDPNLEKASSSSLATTTSSSTSSTAPSENPIVLCLAVSGGCDSMALMHVMKELLQDQEDAMAQNKTGPLGFGSTPPRVVVAHFNHQQRGTESDLDQDLVQQVAEDSGMRFYSYQWNRSELAEGNKQFTQAIARQWRQETTQRLVEDLLRYSEGSSSAAYYYSDRRETKPQGIGVVLTAHHLQDSQESLLLKLLRGSHITNLQGMERTLILPPLQDDDSLLDDGYYQQDSSATSLSTTTYMARPFLGVDKATLQDYLKEQDLAWREDSSNASPKYLRNRVRNELIPLLKELMGGPGAFEKRLNHLDQQSRMVSDDLGPRVQDMLRKSRWSSPGVDYYQDDIGGDDDSVDEADMEQRSFWLPAWYGSNSGGSPTGGASRLVQTQALYEWMQGQMQRIAPTRQERNDNGEEITKKSTARYIGFEQMERIVNQLHDFPDNKDWVLQVGGPWMVRRRGEMLTVEQQGGMADDEDDTGSEKLLPHQYKTIRAFSELESSEASHCLPVCIPYRRRQSLLDDDPTFFVMVRLRDCSTSFRFLPGWKTESSSSPVKLRQFLRSQRVPMERREGVRLILQVHSFQEQPSGGRIVDLSDASLVVVEVNYSWMVDGRYQLPLKKQDAKPGSVVVDLELP